MIERELQEIEAMQAAGGVLPGDVGRLVAEVRRLQAENAALRARAVPAVVWGEPGEFDPAVATPGDFRLLAWDDGTWRIVLGGHKIEKGMAEVQTLDAAKSGCEAAFLRLVGCK